MRQRLRSPMSWSQGPKGLCDRDEQTCIRGTVSYIACCQRQSVLLQLTGRYAHIPRRSGRESHEAGRRTHVLGSKVLLVVDKPLLLGISAHGRMVIHQRVTLLQECWLVEYLATVRLLPSRSISSPNEMFRPPPCRTFVSLW